VLVHLVQFSDVLHRQLLEVRPEPVRRVGRFAVRKRDGGRSDHVQQRSGVLRQGLVPPYETVVERARVAQVVHRRPVLVVAGTAVQNVQDELPEGDVDAGLQVAVGGVRSVLLDDALAVPELQQFPTSRFPKHQSDNTHLKVFRVRVFEFVAVRREQSFERVSDHDEGRVVVEAVADVAVFELGEAQGGVVGVRERPGDVHQVRAGGQARQHHQDALPVGAGHLRTEGAEVSCKTGCWQFRRNHFCHR
jgi:uncharacterized protein YjlB